MSRQRIQPLVLPLALFLTLVPRLVAAQISEPRAFDANRLRPALSAQAPFNVETAVVGEHLEWQAFALLNYVDDPLVLNNSARRRVAELVGHRTDLHLGAVVHVFGRLSVGVDIPIVLEQDRSAGDESQFGLASLNSRGVGDLGLSAKLALLRTDFFDLAVLERLTLPTAYPVDSYTGEGFVTSTTELVLSKSIGDLMVSTNAGVMLRDSKDASAQKLVVGHELIARAGAAYDLQSLTGLPLRALASIEAFTPLTSPFSQSNTFGAEALAGGSIAVSEGLEIYAGVGGPLSAGYSVGDFRALLGLRSRPVIQSEPIPAPALRLAKVELDRDGDTVADGVDNCPDTKGLVEYNGCLKTQLVVIKGCKLDIDNKVFFAHDTATIEARSYPVLNNVAEVILKHDQLKKIHIEGHTDGVGGHVYNMRLSQQRANSVLSYLADRGVEMHRLSAHGYGETRPVTSNASDRGRAANRRVEFLIDDCQEVMAEVAVK